MIKFKYPKTFFFQVYCYKEHISIVSSLNFIFLKFSSLWFRNGRLAFKVYLFYILILKT